MTVDDFIPLAEAAEKALQEAGKDLLERLKPPPGPYPLFHHQSHAVERVRDVLTVLRRLFEDGDRLAVLTREQDRLGVDKHPPSVPFPPEMITLFAEEGELTRRMKIDLESLYVFGTVLLDQWALLTAYLLGLPHPEKTTFNKLVGMCEDEEERGAANSIWATCRQQMLWLHYQVRYYRNHFIIHADRPWQRGLTYSPYGGSANLFIPSPPGWLNDAEIDQRILALLPLAPQWLQRRPPGSREQAPRALLEGLFEHIGEVQRKADRERIAALVGQAGISTPDFTVLGRALLQFIAEATPVVLAGATKYPERVNLGRAEARTS